MEIVAGGLIAVLNQGLLYWRMQQLKRKNIIDPKQVINLASISLVERLMLVGILLVFAMQRLDPLSVILSFFIINLSMLWCFHLSLFWHLHATSNCHSLYSAIVACNLTPKIQQAGGRQKVSQCV